MSDDTLPPPLVPEDVDLRDFPFTPIFRARLFGSSFHARTDDKAWRAGVTLWLKSWDQVPAGTLPDDDIDLCRLAEFARDIKTWRKVKDAALHGWRKCSDGRLHHRVVAEGVLEAWSKRATAKKKGMAGASARWGPGKNIDSTSNATAIAQAMPGDGKGREGTGKGQGKEPVPTADAVGVPDGTLDPPEVPDCPHEKLVALYHEILPTCPRVIEWNDTRRGYLRARWREKAKPNGKTQGYKTVEAGLEWWREFLTYAGGSKFLTGNAEGKPGQRPFVADFEWIVRPTNFAKIIEGRYHG